ncbi:hypothetical protein D0864_11480, partial [Hortaea werneckii]
MTTTTTIPSTPPIHSKCHCGAITLTASRLPDHMNVCQCTMCRRCGAAWGYYSPREVQIGIPSHATTRQYIWGDGDQAFNFCERC